MKSKILLILLLSFTGCSTIKKSLSKQSSKTDSVSVSTSIIDKQTDLQTSKKVDSTGLTTKDKTKTWERETVIEFDTLVGLPGVEWTELIKQINKSQNGNENDFSKWGSKQKIKSIRINEKGTQTKKETQQVQKKVDENLQASTKETEVKKDSTSLKKSETSIVKDKKKTGFSFLGIAVLFSVVTIIGVAYWKRKEIKKKLFGV